jgi:hypothetical protein
MPVTRGIGLACALLAASAAAGHAGEGAREINQACVATGCFPGDTPGLPVQLETAGSYRLTSNLYVPNADDTAIYATAAGATIDLAGFRVQGANTCTGEPVTSCTTSTVGIGVWTGDRGRLFGGTIEGFGVGIVGGRDARIHDVIVSQNSNNGITALRGLSVADSTIVGNGASGIQANSGGGYLEVSGCTIRGNREQGVLVSSGLILESRIHNNGGFGVETGSSTGLGLNHLSGNNGASDETSGGSVIACNTINSQAVCPP